MKNWKEWVGFLSMFFVYALLTLLMTYPAVTQLNTHLIGNGDDMWVHYWNNWWVKRVIQHREGIYHTSLLFHPTGVSLVFHNFAWVNIILWLILEPLLGGISTYNLTFLIHIPLCGLGTFLLVRHLTRANAAAFISGLVYAFWPYRMLHANHPNLIAGEGFPFLMLILLRLARGRTPIRDGLIAGLLMTFIGYTRWQFLVLAGFMIVLYLAYLLIWESQRWNRRLVLGLTLMIVISGVLMSPGLYPLVRGQLAGGLPEEVDLAHFDSEKQDLLTYLVPQPQHPLSPIYDRIFAHYAAGAARPRYTAFLGHIVVGLVILGATGQWRRDLTRFWLALAVLCFVLALGPHPWFRRAPYYNIPLPYRLIGWLPPVKLLGPPRRFNVLLGLPFAILAGYGALTLQEWLADRRLGHQLARPAVISSLLGALLIVDYLSVPFDTVPAHVPRFYYDLAQEDGEFAVLGLPGARKHAEYYMFYQTVHEHPMLSGHVSRLPPQALEFMSSVPFLDGMYYAYHKNATIDTSLPDVSHQLSMLAQAGFRYVVLHKNFVSTQRLTEWQSWLAASPRYEDDEVVVYSTQPVAEEDYVLHHDFGVGTGLIDLNLSADKERPDAPLDIEVTWGTTSPPEAAYQLETTLVDEMGDVEWSERFEISPNWPIEMWTANAIVQDTFSLQIEPPLSAGSYTVVLNLLDKLNGQPVGHRVEAGKVTVHRPEQDFSVIPYTDQRVGVTFGEVLYLLGYDLRTSDARLTVTLHWRAREQMEVDYKFFLHLVDAKTSDLVAQADVMPRAWTYPTSWWENGEVVSDDIGLPLSEIEQGRYRLWVGVYNPYTGERLSVGSTPAGFVAENEQLMLPEEITR